MSGEGGAEGFKIAFSAFSPSMGLSSPAASSSRTASLDAPTGSGHPPVSASCSSAFLVGLATTCLIGGALVAATGSIGLLAMMARCLFLESRAASSSTLETETAR